MNPSNRYATWFGRLVWLGILVNLSFAIPALVAPDAFLLKLGLSDSSSRPDIWLRDAGMLLILLCIFYAIISRDPFAHPGLARMVAFARIIAAGFWAWMLWSNDGPHVLLTFLLLDLSIGLVQWWCISRAFALRPLPSRGSWSRSPFLAAFAWICRRLNSIIPWHRLPGFLGALNLGALRDDLRANNLHDTPEPDLPAPPWDPSYRTDRSPDGSFTDLADPSMGSVNDRFGRNMPLEHCWPDLQRLLQPSPREISRLLLARTTFKPATTLNLLAAAWIQFQNHGWFSHLLMRPQKGEHDRPDNFLDIPLDPSDPWGAGDAERVMRVRRTQPDPTRPKHASYPPTFQSEDTQWWDASQVYGNSLEVQRSLRLGQRGYLRLEGIGTASLLPEDPARPGIDLTGMNDNWWIGLSLLHTLFAREHNAICDEIILHHPERVNDDEWLFQRARHVNAALMAKIHTVEWTPGILNHPAIHISLSANWWGVLGQWVKSTIGRVSESDAISGIIGSSTDHHAMQHAILTEEFVAVYRLHPLIPDDIELHRMDQGKVGTRSFTNLQSGYTRSAITDSMSLTNWFYTMGVQHPGAITLHNYPNTLRDFRRMPHLASGQSHGDRIDLATIDVLRDRERGVPRYNQFRELLRMPRIDSMESLTGKPSTDSTVITLKQLYGDPATDPQAMDRVDLIVGLLAEELPKGFGFSDTAFRIFILMASRRLKSDRFFTTDYNAETYTEVGLKWVDRNTMKDVLLRHYPDLAPALEGIANAFAPWKVIHRGGQS